MNFSIPLPASFLISAVSTTESWLVKMTIGPDPVSFHLRDPNAKGMHALPLCGNDGKRSSNWARGDMKRRQFIAALGGAAECDRRDRRAVICSINTSYLPVRLSS